MYKKAQQRDPDVTRTNEDIAGNVQSRIIIGPISAISFNRTTQRK